MFKIFHNCKEINLYAPVSGRCIPIEEVADAVFATKMLGDGMAFQFDGDTVYAPCEGSVILLPSSRHAVGLKTENGAEILVHVGLNTVDLKGEGFQVLVHLHQKVNKGEALLKLDRAFMDARHIDLTTPMVITNMDSYSCVHIPHEQVNPDKLVMKIKRK